jgi:hypothetical protein
MRPHKLIGCVLLVLCIGALGLPELLRCKGGCQTRCLQRTSFKECALGCYTFAWPDCVWCSNAGYECYWDPNDPEPPPPDNCVEDTTKAQSIAKSPGCTPNCDCTVPVAVDATGGTTMGYEDSKRNRYWCKAP